MTDLRKLHEEASPPPWEADDTSDQFGFEDVEERTGWFRGEQPGTIDTGDYITLSYADVALIAATRNALPYLLDVVEAARLMDEHSFDARVHRGELNRALTALDAHLRETP